ncbi:MAG: HAD family phosphatase [Bacteroidales bacterium]|nr:HAD family phosphatase [Bacteroidales bacterium]
MTKLSPIKNIIFDFGGVIYDIDHQRSKDAFIRLGLNDFDKLYAHTVQTKLFEDFETGKITPNAFRSSIAGQVSEKLSYAEIDAAWNALLLGFKKERLDLLLEIKKHYRLYLLSNTNQIHYKSYMNELKMQNRYELFHKLFERLYFSHQVGLRKPDAKIFEFVLHDSQLRAEETLFIDDFDVNIAAAKQCGLQSLYLKPGQTLLDLFSTDGILSRF